MSTKILFSLLCLAFLAVPLHSKETSSEDNDPTEKMVIKEFPYSEVYVFTKDGEVYHGRYYIVVDYIVKGTDVKECVWNYILRAPLGGLFENATGKGGSFGYDEATGETPRQIFI